MEKYKIIEVSGKGSFGEVFKAVNRENGEIVAIKTMKEKFSTWEECMNLRELKSLRKLQHKNVVKLKEVLKVQSTLSFVFEHVDQDIYKLYENHKKEGTRLSEPEVRSIFYQLAQSLAFIHKHGYFHRDLKPENILIGNKDKVVKLIDFGLAREIRSRPPYTEYVSTRWYRAPELLLRSTNYSSPVDIFALGCIAAELYMLKPLFNGSSEIDQLHKITSVLGTPSKTEWPEGYRLASVKGITIPSYPPIPLSQVISDCPPEAIQLIAECLRWDSNKRPTASKILQHPYFKDIEQVLPKGYFDDLGEIKAQPANTLNTQPSSQIQQSSNYNSNMNSHGNNNDLNVSFGKDEVKVPLAKRMSNQFSQSDVSIVNKAKVTPEYIPIKASDLSSQFGEYFPSSTPQYTYPGGDILSTKPPLNPKRVSRQSQRNPNNNNNNNIKKDSGFNYTDLYNTEDFVEQPKNGQPVAATTTKKSPRDIRNANNNNNNPKLSNFDDLFEENFNGNGIGSTNNPFKTNNSNNIAAKNIPINPQPTSSNQPESQSSFPVVAPSFSSSKQNSSKSTMEYPTSLRMNNNNLYNNMNNPLETPDDNRDILGNYIQPGNSSKSRSHGYSNSQLHPRQLQQISSAVDRRTDIPYSQLNFTASPNRNNYDNLYQPTRSLKPTDIIDKEFSALSQMNPQSNSLKGNNGIGNYREFSSANQATRNGTNLNQMSPYKFSNGNSIASSSSNYPQSTYNYMPSQGMNYLPPSNYPSEIKSYQSAIAPNLASAQYGVSKQNPIITTNNTKNTNALANRNLYDFNNIRQPMRPSGLPLPQYDKKY